jgi:hypothetical protein
LAVPTPLVGLEDQLDLGNGGWELIGSWLYLKRPRYSATHH